MSYKGIFSSRTDTQQIPSKYPANKEEEMSRRTPFDFSDMREISASTFMTKLQELIDLLYWLDNEVSGSDDFAPPSLDCDSTAREMVTALKIKWNDVFELAYKLEWLRNIMMVQHIREDKWRELIADMSADVKELAEEGRLGLWALDSLRWSSPEEKRKILGDGIDTLADLMAHTRKELVKKMGPHRVLVRRIEEDLEGVGLHLKKEEA